MATTDRNQSLSSTPDAGAPSRTGMSRTSLILWGAVALALVLGFVDLIRGGITISAILLTLAYVVLIPAAILKR